MIFELDKSRKGQQNRLLEKRIWAHGFMFCTEPVKVWCDSNLNEKTYNPQSMCQNKFLLDILLLIVVNI